MQNVPVAAMPQQNVAPQKKSFFGAMLSSAGQVATTAGAGMAGGLAVGGVVGLVKPPSANSILEQFVDVYVRENKGKGVGLVNQLLESWTLRQDALKLARESGGMFIDTFDAANNLYKLNRENIKNIAKDAGFDKKGSVIWKEAKKIAKELSAKSIIGRCVGIGAFVALTFMVVKNFMDSSAKKKAYKEATMQDAAGTKLNTVQG